MCDSRELPEHLYPRIDPVARAKVDMAVDWYTSSFFPPVSQNSWKRVVLVRFFGSPSPSVAEEEKWQKESDHALAGLEQMLSENKFMAGEELSIADPLAYPYLSTAVVITGGDFKIAEEFINVKRWLATMESIPEMEECNKRFHEHWNNFLETQKNKNAGQ